MMQVEKIFCFSGEHVVASTTVLYCANRKAASFPNKIVPQTLVSEEKSYGYIRN